MLFRSRCSFNICPGPITQLPRETALGVQWECMAVLCWTAILDCYAGLCKASCSTLARKQTGIVPLGRRSVRMVHHLVDDVSVRTCTFIAR